MSSATAGTEATKALRRIPYMALKKNVQWLVTKDQEKNADLTLTEELEKFTDYVQLAENEVKARENLLCDVTEAVLAKWPQAQVNTFGSYRAGLSIYLSDLDISVLNVGVDSRDSLQGERGGSEKTHYNYNNEEEEDSDDTEEFNRQLHTNSKDNSEEEEGEEEEIGFVIDRGGNSRKESYKSHMREGGQERGGQRSRREEERWDNDDDERGYVDYESEDDMEIFVSTSVSFQKKERGGEVIDLTLEEEEEEEERERVVVGGKRKRNQEEEGAEKEVIEIGSSEEEEGEAEESGGEGEESLGVESGEEVWRKAVEREEIDIGEEEEEEEEGKGEIVHRALRSEEKGGNRHLYYERGDEEEKAEERGAEGMRRRSREKRVVEEDLIVAVVRQSNKNNYGAGVLDRLDGEEMKTGEGLWVEGVESSVGLIRRGVIDNGENLATDPKRYKKAQQLLRQLYHYLKTLGWVKESELRSRARVPIINFTHLSTLQADLSLGLAAQDTSEVVRRLVEIGGRTLFVLSAFCKIYLHQLGLDKPFTGGLGSFKLYLMICSFSLDNPKLMGNLGLALLSFLQYYSREANCNEYTVVRVEEANVSLDKVYLLPQIRGAFLKAYQILSEKCRERNEALKNKGEGRSVPETSSSSSNDNNNGKMNFASQLSFSLLASLLDTSVLANERNRILAHLHASSPYVTPRSNEEREKIAREVLFHMKRSHRKNSAQDVARQFEGMKEKGGVEYIRLRSFYSVQNFLQKDEVFAKLAQRERRMDRKMMRMQNGGRKKMKLLNETANKNWNKFQKNKGNHGERLDRRDGAGSASSQQEGRGKGAVFGRMGVVGREIMAPSNSYQGVKKSRMMKINSQILQMESTISALKMKMIANKFNKKVSKEMSEEYVVSGA